MSSSGEVSPLSLTPAGTPISSQAPKYGTLIPNRIFVGGIAANTNEQELKQFFSAYGAVKDCKIIADRAGVSKGYGFITFETQEDAEKIIKKESDNLIFKDRKLNIGPAIRKQAFPRLFEPNMTPGAVFFSNGVPYTYQNGMAVFQPEGYALQSQQTQQTAAAAAYPMMMQSAAAATQPMYAFAQQGYPYASPTAAATANYAAAAAAAQQWRWAPQSPPQTVAGNQYMYPYQTMPQEMIYATAAGGYASPDAFTEASMLEAAQAEGSMVMEPNLVQQPQYVEVPPAPPTSVAHTIPETPPVESPAVRTTGISYGKRPAAPLVPTPRKNIGYPASSLPYSPRATPPPAKIFQTHMPEMITSSPLTPPPTPEVVNNS